jgi:hypothetical protein
MKTKKNFQRPFSRLPFFLFLGMQIVALALVLATPVYADDCLSNPFNAADCMRTPGFRQGTAVVVSVAATLTTVLVNVLGGWGANAGQTPQQPESTETKIYGTGTKDDPYRDGAAVKMNPDGSLQQYPENAGKPLEIWGSGTKADPYTNYLPPQPPEPQVFEPLEPPKPPETQTPPPTTAEPPKPPETQIPPPTTTEPPKPPETQTPSPTTAEPPKPPETQIPPPTTAEPPIPPDLQTPSPAAPEPPQTPPAGTEKEGSADSSGEDEGKEKEGEGETEKKGPLDAAKDAAKEYGENLDQLSEYLETIKGHLEDDKNLSPEAKEKLKNYIDSFNESLGKAREKAEDVSKGIGKYTDLRDKVTEITKELDKNIQEIAKGHTKALNDLKDLPQDAANQAADLSAALDAFGRAANAALNKVPGYKAVGGDKTFQVTKSFQEAGKGVQKAIRVIKTSETEAAGLSKDGDVPGYTPKHDYNNDPEVIRIRREAAKNRGQSTYDWLKEKILGKTPDESVKQFR